jgi:hypothetical protein
MEIIMKKYHLDDIEKIYQIKMALQEYQNKRSYRSANDSKILCQVLLEDLRYLFDLVNEK